MNNHERRPLTREEIQYFREKLLNRKKELWQEIIHKLRQEGAQGYQDLIKTLNENEDLAAIYLKEEALFSLVEPKVYELDEIEQALIRIENGEYGRCIDCGKWLRLKRLKIMPWAARCRECKEKWEQLKALE